ncbi:MAG: hypothetical protein O3C10_03430 [Chloroflexi bacterium]|nr:hypothetical protein [Chloroflexota bacterium]
MSIEYHNGSIGGRRLSWDVHRLRANARGVEPAKIKLSEIFEFDSVYWFDDEYLPTCRAVVEHACRTAAADVSDPILLSHDGYVIDGMHRVARAMLDGFSAITAIRLTDYPEPDFVTEIQV